MNVKLIRRIQKAILAEPKRVNMSDWAFHPSWVAKRKLPRCNTVTCIAGWAVALDRKLRGAGLVAYDCDGVGIAAAGRKALDLPSDFYGPSLFSALRWPEPYASRIAKYNSGTKRYAKVVAARLDYLIKEGK